MNKRRSNERLHLDMPLAEAVDRVLGVGLAELEANNEASKTKEPPSGLQCLGA